MYCTYTFPSLNLSLRKYSDSDSRAGWFSTYFALDAPISTTQPPLNVRAVHPHNVKGAAVAAAAALIPDYDSSPRKLKPLNASNKGGNGEGGGDAKLKTACLLTTSNLQQLVVITRGIAYGIFAQNIWKFGQPLASPCWLSVGTAFRCIWSGCYTCIPLRRRRKRGDKCHVISW